MSFSPQDPLDLEELAAVYRVERKSPSLSAVRRDLYPAMAGLMSELRIEYNRRLADDPDSLLCEGASQNRRRCETLVKDIVELRMNKICSLALRDSMGARNPLDQLTDEEREYHDSVSKTSRQHYGMVFRLSGSRRYKTPPIDAPADTAANAPAAGPAADEPVGEPPAADIRAEPPMPAATAPGPPADAILEETLDLSDDEVDGEAPLTAGPAPVAEPVPDMGDDVVLRVLEDLPEFSGTDRVYRLSKEDVVTLPRPLAEALVRREKAVLLNPSA
jgi:DNA replication factor GINS